MKIRRRKYRNGKSAWQLDLGKVDGKRILRAFATKVAAEIEAARIVKERRKHGDSALAMSHERRLRYATFEKRLSALGVSLDQAIVWVEERAGGQSQRPLAALFPDFMEDRRRAGLRPRYLKQLRVSVGHFVRAFPERRPLEIGTDDVKAWLHGSGWQPVTQKGYLGDIASFFRWAVGSRGRSPCENVKSPKIEQAEIEVLSPEQVEHLFATAFFTLRRVRYGNEYRQEFAFRPLLAYVAIATFCGVRPEEVRRSGPKALDVENKVFVVAGTIAKTARRRVVNMPPAVLAWLALWRKQCGQAAPVVPRNFLKLWARLREAAQLKPPGYGAKKLPPGAPAPPAWPKDALRHTTATMHYATHQNAALLKAELGHHDGEDTLYQHYRAVRLMDGRAVTPALAARFWEIVPTPAMLAA